MKPWYTSKVIWANVLATVAALLAAPEIQAAFGPDTLKYVVCVQAGVNIVLRFITVAAIGPQNGRGPDPGRPLNW